MYRFVAAYAHLITGGYYRVRRVGGPVPLEGPLIIVGNHTNGLMDPALMLAYLPRRPVRFLAKFKLFEMPVIGAFIRGAGAIPVYRQKDNVPTSLNESSFEAGFQKLADGDAMCIFPEGTSSSQTELQKLKTGAARMALGAEAAYGFSLGLRFLPIGIVYSNRDRFRSRVDLWVGEPFGIGDYRDAYAEDERAAVGRVTEDLARSLRRVTVNHERREERPLLELAERVWEPDGRERSMRLADLALGLGWMREHRPERARAFIESTTALRDALVGAGATVDALADRGLRRIIGRVVLGFPTVVLATVVSAIASAVPALVSRGVGYAIRPTEDKLITVTTLSATVLFPLWFAAVGLAIANAFSPAVSAAVCVPWLALTLATTALWPCSRALIADLGAVRLRLRGAGLRADLEARRDAVTAELAQWSGADWKNPAS